MNKLNYLSSNWLALKINNEFLARHLRIVTGHVIDLGCGTAPYKHDILGVADSYIGVDWKNTPHDQSGIDIFADLSVRLPFDDNGADTVVSFQVLEHVPEPVHFLSECFRLLKPGGRILVTTPFMWQVHETPHDYYRYTRYGLEYLLKKTGFSEIEVQELTGFWQMFVLKFNYHTARFAFGPIRLLLIPVWWFGQIIAPSLDKWDRDPAETASYAVVARKPT